MMMLTTRARGRGQAAGDQVRHIAEGLDGAGDFATGLAGDALGPAQEERHRRLRHAGECRDLGHGHALHLAAATATGPA